MEKIHIVGLNEEKEALIHSLMNSGAVELSENINEVVLKDSDSTEEERENTISPKTLYARELMLQMKIAIEQSDRFYKEKKPMFASKREVDKETFEEVILQSENIKNMAEELSNNISKISSMNSDIISNNLIVDQIKPWKDVRIELGSAGTKTVEVLLGVLASLTEVETLRETLWSQVEESDVIILFESEDIFNVAVIFHKDFKDNVSLILKNSPFRQLAMSSATGYPEDIFNEYLERIKHSREKIKTLTKKCEEISKNISKFEIIYDYSSIMLQKVLAESSLFDTQYTFALEGWVPAHLTDSVEAALNSKYTIAFKSEKTTSEDEYPILLKNHPLVKPYEVITEMFSPPSTKDIDPTPIMAPFFLVIFSMMLGDAGYGLILALGCALLIWKFKVTGDMRSMAMYIFQGGLAAIIWGFLFGGFFGDLVTAVTMGKVHFPTLWFNPLDDPTKLMIWSVILGILHMFAGMFTKAHILIVTGKWKDAVIDVFSWIFIITGIGLLLGGPALKIATLSQIGKYMIFSGIGVIILFGGRGTKNPIMRILKGVIGLYDITSYFSDALSYTRILALSLATAVIAMVVNMLGGIIGFNFAGILLFIIVGILGHLLNLAISTLGCYVHTSRLQYVEFFSKFYEGGGRMWEPLSIQTKYIDVVNKEKMVKKLYSKTKVLDKL